MTFSNKQAQHGKRMKLSVFVVTYNQEKYIAQCLDSILMQKVDFDYEIVIGEDHGTDGTRAICEEYADKHPKIRLLPLIDNIGVVKNWIRTIGSCQGDFIALCEGDDYWTNENKLQEEYNYLLNNQDYGLVYGNYSRYYEATDKFEECDSQEHKQGKVFSNLVASDFIAPLTVMFRKSILQNAITNVLNDIPPILLKSIDYPIMLNVALLSNIAYIPHNYGVYRIITSSISNTGCILRRAQYRESMLAIANIYLKKINPIKNPQTTRLDKESYKKLLYKNLTICNLYSQCRHLKDLYRNYISCIKYIRDFQDVKAIVKSYLCHIFRVN